MGSSKVDFRTLLGLHKGAKVPEVEEAIKQVVIFIIKTLYKSFSFMNK
jgi:hypothetical protein